MIISALRQTENSGKFYPDRELILIPTKMDVTAYRKLFLHFTALLSHESGR
jgi:hypothetical protein